MRGETSGGCAGRVCGMEISIHSPHARGDIIQKDVGKRPIFISIHSPHARGDTKDKNAGLRAIAFQSTPLMRGETLTASWHGVLSKNFNPLPSCEGRRSTVSSPFSPLFNFNPLPSCEGRLRGLKLVYGNRHFNPLPSCEGRQHKPLKIRLDSRQSIQQKHHSSFF